MKKQVRIGFIGAGAFISARHLMTAGEMPFMEIAAIADLNQELLARHAATYKVGYTTTDYHRLLNDPDIDLIVIGTRQDTHAKLIVESLNAGKWVWCEKPMCEERSEEAPIIEAEKRAKGRLAIGFNRRFAPAITKTMEILKKLPQPWIFSYRLQSNGGHKTARNDTYYANRPHIIYEGCHILDLANFMIGQAPNRVYMSTTGNDNVLVTMEYPNSARFSLVMTATAGSSSLEKEAMDIFTPGGALSLNDFIELRVRGIDGESDQLFEPFRCPFAKEVLRWGFDFWQKTFNRTVLQDESPTQHIVPIELGQSEQPFSAVTDEIEKAMAGKPWPERNFCPDKGWTDAFCHFAKACMDNTVPLTANGQDGYLASELGYALLESAAKGIPVDFKNTL